MGVRVLARRWRPFLGRFDRPLDSRRNRAHDARVVTAETARSNRPTAQNAAALHCMECNVVLDGTKDGKVRCVCGVDYIIRLNDDGFSKSLISLKRCIHGMIKSFCAVCAGPVRLEEPKRTKVSFNQVQKMSSRLPHESITFEPYYTDEPVDVKDGFNIHSLSCVICHKDLIACMSVRVSKPVFTDYETQVPHPANPDLMVTEVRSRPSSKIGRAHTECANIEESKPYGFKMVDIRTTPSKTQRSIGSRENDRLLDKWVTFDRTESVEFE